MNLAIRHVTSIAVLAAALVPVLAQEKGLDPSATKQAVHDRMVELQREIFALSSAGALDHQIEHLRSEYDRLSSMLGGYRPSESDRVRSETAQPPAGAMALVAAPSACGFTPSTGSFAGTTGAIGSPSMPTSNVFTTVVGTLDTYLWDVNLNTAFTHTNSADIDMTLTSPLGTVVTITTDNGGTNDNVFNGTLWDDNVNDPVTDRTFVNLTAATPLSPEGRLQSFRGENPNGVWTLTITDDAPNDAGSLTSWSLDISTLSAAPVTTTTGFPKVSGLAVGPGVLTTTDTVLVSGMGTYLMETELFITLPHINAADLDITLTSPNAGPAVKVTTDNGGTNDNVYNGTVFDVDAPVPVTDAIYANLVLQPLLSPEGAFDNWLGQDPNGTWTLTVVDDAASSGGTLVNWTVTATTIPAPTPSAPVNYPGTTGPIVDATPNLTGTFAFTTVVSLMPNALWDVDLNTTITHTWSEDLDIFLTSPGGTTVTITTDNGGSNDNTFNGTLWDDNINDPITDQTFANNVAEGPVSPEGRLGAFRGENPNGTWTLTVVDDAAGDGGNLGAWSLDLAALPSLPPQASTTLSQSPALAIPTVVGAVSDTIAVAVPGTSITEVEVYMEILHASADQLDITLTSPALTVVKVTTDNGGSNDDVYNGTLFDPDVLVPVTDHLYANLVVAPLLSPEGSFDNFVGQNPNGNWTLTVADDTTATGGTFTRWDLTIRTCSFPAPVAYCFGDGTGTPCPCLNSGAAGNGCANAINVNGAKLASSGVSSVSGDTLTLLGTGMTNSYVLYFQGTGPVAGGLGSTFGDGLRCANGVQVRLGTHLNALGASMHPNGNPPISVAGGVAPGDTRYYQGWYRDANPTFCPFPLGDTFNLTNGMMVFWAP